MSAADEKAALRREMRRLRKAVSREERAAASRRLCDRLLADGLGPSVAVYLAGPDELDLTDFICGSLRRGVRVFAPRWTGETYALAEVRGLDATFLREGPHGIREPRDAAPPEGEARPAAWVVPGLAFTRDGKRLGYGGGWYDRLLREAEAGADVIGVAYPFQVLDDLPAESHDVRVRRVLCPSSLFGCPTPTGRVHVSQFVRKFGIIHGIQ